MFHKRSLNAPLIPLIIIGIIAALFIAYGMIKLEEQQMVMLTFGFSIMIISFLSTEVTLLILILSMLLSPEIILGTSSSGSLSRGVTLRAEDILLLIIGFTWVMKTAIYKNLGLFLKTPLNTPMMVYTGACLFSTILGIITDRVSPSAGILFVTKYFQYFFIYFMVVNHLSTNIQLKRYLIGFYVTCVAACIFGIAYMPVTKRVSAPFEGDVGEPNTFGGYLVLLLSVALGIFLSNKNNRLRLLFLPVFIIGIISLALTLSRSSYLALFASYIALIYFERNRRLLLVLLLVFGTIILPILLPSSVIDRITYTFQQDRYSVKVGTVALDGSTSARINSYLDVLSDWGQHPLLGYGVTGYKFIDAQYVKILIDTGLVGLLSFLYLLFSLFQHLHRIKSKVLDTSYRGIITGFQAGYIGLLVHSLGTNTFIIVRIMEPFWFLVAIITMLPTIELNNIINRSHSNALTSDYQHSILHNLKHI